MSVINPAGRTLPETIAGTPYKPFTKAHKNNCDSKVVSLKKALQESGLKDGQTISFHHQLRNGDYVVNHTLDVIREMGVKNIRLAQTALFPIHEPVIDHIKEGTVNRIEGSINGTVGDYVSKNPLSSPVVLRSHGGRWAAVRNDELHIDIAIIAASAADNRGNCTGLIGKSAFGPICYSQVDAFHADNVIIITDNLVDRPCGMQEINEGYVDFVVEMDQIGNPKDIVSGSLKVTSDPQKLHIAQQCIHLMEGLDLIKDGLIFQAGAGGISLAALEYLDAALEEKDAVASYATGGFTNFIVDMHKKGILKHAYGLQCFDVESIKYIANTKLLNTDIGHYADSSSKGRYLDGLHATMLGATEVDTNFNVNVNTHSDGRLLHGIGGHQDSACGANLTMITVPVYRKTIPVIRDSVTTITTPGDVIDAIVTDQGIAINPKRKDLLDKLKGNNDVNLVSIDSLKQIADDETGGPPELDLGDEIIGITKWRNGELLDVIYRVKE
jgi:citrate lyase subunit alpha / citrate CoA-transferase